MYQKIIVALDLSEQSDVMLQKAKAIIEHCQADYRICFVYEQPVFPWGEMSISMPAIDFDDVKASIVERLHETVTDAGLDSGCIEVIDGFVADSIVSAAQSFSADLILIGSHGVKGVQLLLGSTADKVLHQAPCDVLAVRVK
jgi:universal stress protein A